MLQTTVVKSPREPRNEGGQFLIMSPDMTKVRELQSTDTKAVLDFLSIRPVHTVVMTSFIKDNGITSDLNRGRFYGYRNSSGKLEGIALIGHSTLVEARTDAALKALAFKARTSTIPIHLIMSSGRDAETFWNYLSGGVREPRLKCTEALFEISFPFPVQHSEWRIKNADMSHLLPVAEAQAEVAFIECGIDPMVRDREGFLRRVARRIEQNRVYVVMDGDKMVFKADIIAETDDVIYLEGIYVAPDFRGRGVGSECLSSLALDLLGRAGNVCLLSNVKLEGAYKSFQKAGFRKSDHCTTLFV